jgi:DNA-binding LacI/PurR family transcriptional regulator
MERPDPPTAVFASNDMMAIGALRAASELGLRVPGDLSMIGFDDLEITRYTCPTLTTIAQPKEEIGRAAVQRLIELLEGSAPDGKRILIPPMLVMRESTSPNRRLTGAQQIQPTFTRENAP